MVKIFDDLEEITWYTEEELKIKQEIK